MVVAHIPPLFAAFMSGVILAVEWWKLPLATFCFAIIPAMFFNAMTARNVLSVGLHVLDATCV